ncbi:MAG: TIGR03936 family radical SAM-associated protein [Planctomycetota bacterium]
MILEARKLGARFDSWTEQFNEEAWKKAFNKYNISMDNYLREFNENEVLAWSHIDCGINRDYLLSERGKSLLGEETQDCRYNGCVGCGVCDSKKGETPSKFLQEKKSISVVDRNPKRYGNIQFRYRIIYTKLEKAAFIGHLELKQILERAFRRAELPLKYSEGFHPEPKISYSPPVPLGIESNAELLDMRLTENIPPAEIINRVNPLLPHGVALYNAKLIATSAPSITASVKGNKYIIDISQIPVKFTQEEISRLTERFLSQSNIPFIKERKGKVRKVNMRDFVTSIEIRKENQIEITTNILNDLQIRVTQILYELLQVSEEQSAAVRIKKISNILYFDSASNK